jgi:hypothetical protein
MIQKSQDGKYWCLNCNKSFSERKAAKRHAEIHLNVAHHCIVCQRVFKTRNGLATHYTRYHPDEVASPWSMK